MLRFSTKQRIRPTINLTALIDMVFLLLVFFLLASNFVEQQGVAIIVPEMESSNSKIQQQILININAWGDITIDNVSVDSLRLKNVLEHKFKNNLTDSIIIRADRRVDYNSVVEAIDAAKLAGANNILLVTRHKTAQH